MRINEAASAGGSYATYRVDERSFKRNVKNDKESVRRPISRARPRSKQLASWGPD
jgi:hypothetical protein